MKDGHRKGLQTDFGEQAMGAYPRFYVKVLNFQEAGTPLVHWHIHFNYFDFTRL